MDTKWVTFARVVEALGGVKYGAIVKDDLDADVIVCIFDDSILTHRILEHFLKQNTEGCKVRIKKINRVEEDDDGGEAVVIKDDDGGEAVVIEGKGETYRKKDWLDFIENVDIIILDDDMLDDDMGKNSFTGMELMKMIKERYPNKYIISNSSSGDIIDFQIEATSAGADVVWTGNKKGTGTKKSEDERQSLYDKIQEIKRLRAIKSFKNF